MFLRTRARLVDAKCIIVLHTYIHDNIPTYACTWQDSQWTCTALVRHPPTHPPRVGGSSCAIFRQSGVRGGGGIGGARVRSVSDSSSRWYTRSVPVQLPCDTRASRVFPKKKKNSNIIATNRNNTPVVIFVRPAQYTNNCFFFFIYYATSYYRYYVEFKNFESKRVLSHPHHYPASSFLVSFSFL